MGDLVQRTRLMEIARRTGHDRDLPDPGVELTPDRSCQPQAGPVLSPGDQ